MTDAQPSKSLFLVVDRLGGRSAVSAECFLVCGQEVSFSVAGRLVASFSNPVSVIATTAGTASKASDLVPGEAPVSLLESDRGLVPAAWAMVVVVASMVVMRAIEVFWW